MEKNVEQAFEGLNKALILSIGSGNTSFPEKILYASLLNSLNDLHFVFGQAAEKIGKEKTAPGVGRTESGMENNSINKYITINVNSKANLPPELQQFTENFICTIQKIKKQMKE